MHVIPLDYFRAAVPFFGENELRALSKAGKGVRKIAASYLNNLVFQRLYGALTEGETSLKRGKQILSLLSYTIKDNEILSFDGDEYPVSVYPNVFQRYMTSRYGIYNRTFTIVSKIYNEFLGIDQTIMNQPLTSKQHPFLQMRDKAQRIIVNDVCIRKLNNALDVTKLTCETFNIFFLYKFENFNNRISPLPGLDLPLGFSYLYLKDIQPHRISLNPELDVELKYVDYTSVFSFFKTGGILLGSFHVDKGKTELVAQWASFSFTKTSSHLKIPILQWIFEIFLKEKEKVLLLQTRLYRHVENPLFFEEGGEGLYQISFHKINYKLTDSFKKEACVPLTPETWENYIEKNRMIQDSRPLLPNLYRYIHDKTIIYSL